MFLSSLWAEEHEEEEEGKFDIGKGCLVEVFSEIFFFLKFKELEKGGNLWLVGIDFLRDLREDGTKQKLFLYILFIWELATFIEGGCFLFRFYFVFFLGIEIGRVS